MVFSVRSANEATISHLEITIITKKKLQQDRSKGKIMLLFNSYGIVHIEFIPEGQTVKSLQGDPSLSTIQFIINILSFGAGRNGCCYMKMPLNIALCLYK
jgi:hypothetical protein